MTGPDHYREAEKILTQVVPALDKAERHGVDLESLSAGVSISLAMAQVHATLALAAATAYPAIRDYCGDEASEPREWAGATS